MEFTLISDNIIGVAGDKTKAERVQKSTDRRECSASPTGPFNDVIKLGIDNFDFAGLEFLHCPFEHVQIASLCIHL